MSTELPRCPHCGTILYGPAPECPECAGPIEWESRGAEEEPPGGRTEEAPNPLYRRTWFLLTLCIFVPPVGVALIWLLEPRPFGDVLTWTMTILAAFFLITYVGDFSMRRSESAAGDSSGSPPGTRGGSPDSAAVAGDPARPVSSTARMRVSRHDFQTWPFTVDAGELRCLEPQRAVVFAPTEGGTYAVNGAARALGYRPIQPIRRDDPDMPGVPMNVNPLLDRGLDLCRSSTP